MEITYLGHSAFKIEADGKIIFLDPWLGGPASPMTVDSVDDADICLVTHDHGDHGYSEAVEICKKTGAYFVAINELALKAKSAGVENVHTLNIGGSIDINGVVVTLVQAFHSCKIGSPTGFIIQLDSGTVYHAGDTGIFYDMKLFGDMYDIDIAMLPIGSYYTMSIKQASKATSLIRPKAVIPMHYNTFPVIETDPEEFRKLVSKESPESKVEVFDIGDTRDIAL
ncbi:metal-dependent hydrolase [Candidatus Thorarchaeota archaeon]|nr:MAG: metal-dependent hydrolase [Candidatus Thorarchaeota archaeon]